MVIKNFGFDDDLFDDEFQQQFSTKQNVSPVVSQEEAERAASIANAYPNLPASVIAAAAKMGLGFNDNRLTDVARKVELLAESKFNKIKRFVSDNPLAQKMNDNLFFQMIGSPIDNVLKPITRGIFTGLEDIRESIGPALARAEEIQNQNPDMSFSDAYKQAVKGTLRTPKILEAIRSGENFDMGRGWLALETDPANTDEYKRLVASGYDPIQARQYVLDNVLGVQINKEVKETANNIVQFQGELGEQFKNAGLNPSVSPGRKVFEKLGGYNVYEPGTEEAHKMTGALDIGFQLLSPENWVTFGVGKAKEAKRLFNVAERLDDAGVITKAIRSTIHGPTVQQYLAGKKGQEFKKLLFENADNPFEIITRTKESITDASFFSDLKKLIKENNLTKWDNTTEKFIDDFLTSKVTKDALDQAAGVGSSRLIDATNMYVPKVIRGNRIQTAMKLYFAPAYGRLIDANDPAETLQNLYRFSLQSKTFLKESPEGVNLANKLLNNAIEAYGKGGDIGASMNKVVADWLENDFYKVLTESGVKESVAKAATKIARDFGEEANIAADMNKGLYGTFTSGNKFPVSETLKNLGVDEEVASTVGRAIFSTQINNTVYLPELSKVIKASNQMSDILKRGNMTKLVDTLGGEVSESFIRTLDWYNSDIFKPLALIKPAWTLKVVGEEQIRLIARGISSAPLAPIQILARMFGRSVGDSKKLRKGVDPLLPSEAAGGSWLSDLLYNKSLTGTGNVRTARRKVIDPARWELVGKGNPNYQPSVLRNIFQILNDELGVKVAKIEASSLSPLQKQSQYNKLVDEIFQPDGVLRKRLEYVVGEASHPFHKALQDREVAQEYLYYLRAALHQTTGGNVEEIGKSAFEWVARQGDQKLLEMIANGGEFVSKSGNTVNLTQLTKLIDNNLAKGKYDKKTEKLLNQLKVNRKVKSFEELAEDYLSGKIVDEDFGKLQDIFQEIQTSVSDSFFATFSDVLPNTVRGEIAPNLQTPGLYDKVINNAFNLLMTQPTNKLSRSPAFRRFYWKRVSETIEFLGKDARDEMVAIANKSLKEFTAYDPILSGYLKKINSAKFSGPAEAITDIKIYDKMIASDALTQTKKLLYDISERTRVGDSLRFAFPFLEAYLEIFKTWGDITNKAGGKNLINLYKLQDGAKEPNPLADPTGQRGFFYTNPVNGQSVFAYPGTGLIQKWMFPELQDTSVDASFPVYVSSVNLAADIMPGFGPIIRVPASYLRKNFPEESTVNQLIFGDFSPPSGFLEGVAPFPAWLKKFYQAYKKGGSGNADLNRIFNNTVIDTYKALVYAGVINDSSPQGAEEGLALATQYAQKIFIIRGASQLIGPAGAATPLWTVTDKSGKALFIEALADTYREYKAAANGDDYEATQRFIKEFGVDPTILAVSKSKSVVARPQTVFASDWARENKDLYDEFNTTAFYLTPTDIDNEFSYDAYLNTLQEGTRVPRTPEQWVFAKNRLLGSIAYENFLRNTKVGGVTLMNTNTKTAQLLKWMKQSQLMTQYWGYGQDAGFETDKPDTDFLLQEMGGQTYLPDRTSSFKQGWIKSDYTPIDKLKDNNAAIAYGQYRKAYLATKLILEYPEFGPLYNSILENELREQVSDIELLGM
jgi:hypothetical protein